MEQRVDESLVGRRFVVLLLTTFAGLALLLAALGLYGVISYSVRMRTRELGVRMALGAQRSRVMQLVLMQGARLAAIGIICGVLAALGAGSHLLQPAVPGRMLSAIPGLRPLHPGCGRVAGTLSARPPRRFNRADAGAADGVKTSSELTGSRANGIDNLARIAR